MKVFDKDTYLDSYLKLKANIKWHYVGFGN